MPQVPARRRGLDHRFRGRQRLHGAARPAVAAAGAARHRARRGADVRTSSTCVAARRAARSRAASSSRLRNGGAGHGFPTGVTDIRSPGSSSSPRTASGNVVAHLGGRRRPPDLLPPGAARLGIDLAPPTARRAAPPDQRLATRIPFDVRVPVRRGAGPLHPPAGLFPRARRASTRCSTYRNVRTTYYRGATGDPMPVRPRRPRWRPRAGQAPNESDGSPSPSLLVPLAGVPPAGLRPVRPSEAVGGDAGPRARGGRGAGATSPSRRASAAVPPVPRPRRRHTLRRTHSRCPARRPTAPT